MNRALPDQLDMMAIVWDELAVGSSTLLFHERFLLDLKQLDDFQRDFPAESPVALVRLLESKVLDVLRRQFAGSEFLRLRAKLNHSN
ncbi:MAG: hypothetical protein EOP86_18780 [Verrucomicrobiaceae bacterium]|nr:MAG: hypothetical protein EOP86_18780 [Verrucomicrobiaceae bacterium]